ncbi:hypothetical protein ACFQZC_23350 [Streptacidiphilus monticola]
MRATDPGSEYLAFVDSDDTLPGRLPAAAGHPGQHRLRLRRRQRADAPLGGPLALGHAPQGLRRDEPAHPHQPQPRTDRRPHRLEQGLPPQLLGQAPAGLAGGRALRGCAADPARPLPGHGRGRAGRAGLPLAPA